MAWTAKITGAADVAPALLVALHQGQKQGLVRVAAKAQELVQQNISTPYDGRPAAVASETLVRAIGIVFTDEPDRMMAVVGVGPELKAFGYAAPVETGARPHMPPASALLPWVKLKFGIEDEKQALSMAFAVAFSIRKKGTQGHQMFSRALAAIEPVAPGLMEFDVRAQLNAAGFTSEGASV